MYKFYDVSESQLAKKGYEAEALFFCRDTGNIYVDSIVEQERVQIAKDIIVLATEADKPLAPQPSKLYAVISTGALYIYNGTWIKLGHKEQFHFKNVSVTNKTLVISDSRITATDTATFIPDLSVVDLVASSTVTCATGTLTVNLALVDDAAEYTIPGEVIVNN